MFQGLVDAAGERGSIDLSAAVSDIRMAQITHEVGGAFRNHNRIGKVVALLSGK